MAGKKDTDATKNLPPDRPTQVGPGGTKLGLPTRGEVMAALRRVAKADRDRPSSSS
jgi:hypothetical protein